MGGAVGSGDLRVMGFGEWVRRSMRTKVKECINTSWVQMGTQFTSITHQMGSGVSE